MKIQKKLLLFVMVAILSLSNLAYAAQNILNDEAPCSAAIATKSGDTIVISGGDPDPIGW